MLRNSKVVSSLFGPLITKYHRLCGLWSTKSYFSQFWDQKYEIWVKVIFWVTDFLLYPHMVEGTTELSGAWASFIKALIPFINTLPLWFDHPLPSTKLPLSNTITLDIRISTYEFRGYTNIQPSAGRKKNPCLLTINPMMSFFRTYYVGFLPHVENIWKYLL